MQPQPNADMDEAQEADAQGQESGADDKGNISGNQLALLFGGEDAEAEDVPTEAEVAEPDGGNAEPEDSEAAEELETEYVLSHSEEEAEEPEVPKSTQKLLKQVSKLTARAKGAEEKLAEQVEELETLRNTGSKDAEVGQTGIPKIDKIQSLEDLEKMRQEAITAKRWALSHIGKDYVEDGNEEYDGDQIRDILRKSEDFLMEHIPARQVYLQEREASEVSAREDFPVWRGEDAEGEQLVMSILGNKELMGKTLSQLPNQKYMIGLMYEGMKVVEARKGEAGKTPAKRKAAQPPPATEGARASPQPETRGDKVGRKKIEALGTENVSARQLTEFFTD